MGGRDETVLGILRDIKRKRDTVKTRRLANIRSSRLVAGRTARRAEPVGRRTSPLPPQTDGGEQWGGGPVRLPAQHSRGTPDASISARYPMDDTVRGECAAIRDFLATGERGHLRRVASAEYLLALLREDLGADLRLRCLAELVERDRLEAIEETGGCFSVTRRGDETDGRPTHRRLRPIKNIVRDTPKYNSISTCRIRARMGTVYGLAMECNRLVIFELDNTRDELFCFINENIQPAAPAADIPVAVESLLLSIRMSRGFSAGMLVNIYERIKAARMSSAFIHTFFNCDIANITGNEKAFVRTSRAKMLFCSYKMTGEIGRLRGCLRILRGMRAREALYKVYYHIGDYYSAMDNSSGLRYYMALSAINTQWAVEALSKSFGLACSQSVSDDDVIRSIIRSEKQRLGESLNTRAYGRGTRIKEMVLLTRLAPDDSLPATFRSLLAMSPAMELKVEFLRFLKRVSLQSAHQYAQLISLLQAYKCSQYQLLLYEAYLVARRLSSPSARKLLHRARSHTSSPLFIQEISRLGSTHAVRPGDPFAGLFYLRLFLSRPCNSSGCCPACQSEYAEHLLSPSGNTKYSRPQDDGDLLILDYFVRGDLSATPAADLAEPAGGYYWPQVSHCPTHRERTARGLQLARLDATARTSTAQ